MGKVRENHQSTGYHDHFVRKCLINVTYFL